MHAEGEEARMRTQEFGVEIELKGLDRHEAAGVTPKALGGTASSL